MVADPDKNVPAREPVHELCEQLDLLRAVTSAHGDAMFVKNLAGVYLYCNEAASRFVGRSCSEIVGRTDAELLEPEAAERIRVQDRRVAVTEKRETEDHIITVAGKPCLFETSKMPYRNSIGEVVGVIGIAREVSVSREEIQSLRESEERYRSLVAAMAEGVVVQSANGEIVTCNERAERILGLSADQICGKSSLDPSWHCLREDGTAFPGHEHPAMETLRTGLACTGVVMMVHKPDGTETWITINSEPLIRKGESDFYGVVCSFSEITDRRSTEQALRKSQRRLGEAQEIAGIGSWEWNPNSGQVWWSDALYRLFGVSQESVVPAFEVFLSLLHPDDQYTAIARVEEMLAGGQEFANDLRIIRPDGQLLWLHSRARATRNAEGAIILVEGTDQDITARKTAEQSLEDRERNFRELADAIPQIVWIAGPDGALTSLNSKAREYTGVSVNQLTGWDWGQVIHPEDLPRTLEDWTQILQEQVSRDMEFRIRRADGAYRWHITRQVPSCDASGAVIRWYGTCTDIEDLKHAEALLRNERTLLRTLIDSIPDLVFTKDTHGRFVLCNKALLKFTGHTREEEIIGKTDSDFFPAEHANASEAIERLVIDAAGMILEQEEQTRDALGCDTWREVIRAPLRDHEGIIVGLVGISQDIQKRKEREQELADSQERLQLALSAATMGTWDWDVQSHTMFRSEECLAISGMSHRTGEPAEFLRTIHPDDADAVTKRIEQAISQHSRFAMEFRIVRPDGEVRWISEIGSTCYDSDQKPVRMTGIIQDITERKRSEIALRENESRLRIAMQAAVAVAFEWDPQRDFVIRYYSTEPTLPSNVGHPEKLADVRERVHPDDRAAFDAKLQACLDSGTEYRSLYRIVRPDSSIRWLEEWGKLERGPDDQPLRLTGVSIDVTERKAAEKALRLTQFSTDRAVDAVFWINEEGRILYVNDAACSTLGYSPDELVGQFVPTIDPNFPRDAWPAHWKELKLKGSLTFESDHVTKVGSTLRTEVTANYLKYEGQEYNCAIMRDITLRRQTEEERDRLWNHAVDPLCIAGFDGKFRQLNPAWTRTLGWSESELNSQPWMEFVHPADHDATAVAGEKLMRGETVTGFQNRYRCKNGDYRWFSWNAIPQAESGTIFGFIRDVTEARQLEEQLRQSQKMEAIGRLAGGIAHDFNNLLTVINGYSEMVLQDLPKTDPLRLALSAIRNAGDRAAELTSQLLAFSRKAIIEPKILDLNEVIKSTSQMLRRLIGDDIVLTVTPNDVPCLIRADPGQLEQVIMNLTVNARDAMPKGGRLTIQTSMLSVGPQGLIEGKDISPGQYTRLVVSDSGHGVPEEIRGKIFEPFFTTKGPGKGTGLGLAVVHGVVKQCGGYIDVFSTSGGTSFELLFPVASGRPTAAAAETGSPVRLGSETLLLVEDNDAVRNITRIALESQGFQVLEACNGSEAIQLLDQYSGMVRLLITDVVMPGMGGREPVGLLRERGSDLQVLYISGHTDNEIVLDNVRDTFLQKPFTPMVLAKKVRAVLDEKK